MAQKYTLDTKKKIITATIEDLDTVEKEIVQMYVNAGYIIHKGKSNPWNKTTIYKWLKKYVSEKDAEEFIADCEDKHIGWVSARSNFFDKYDAKKREELEKAFDEKEEKPKEEPKNK